MIFNHPLTPLQVFDQISTLPHGEQFSCAQSLTTGVVEKLTYSDPIQKALSNITRGPKTDPDGRLKQARADYLEAERLVLGKYDSNSSDSREWEKKRAYFLSQLAAGGSNFSSDISEFAKRVHQRALDYIHEDLKRIYENTHEVSAEVYVNDYSVSAQAVLFSGVSTVVESKAEVLPVVWYSVPAPDLDALNRTRSSTPLQSGSLRDGIFEGIVGSATGLESREEAKQTEVSIPTRSVALQKSNQALEDQIIEFIKIKNTSVGFSDFACAMLDVPNGLKTVLLQFLESLTAKYSQAEIERLFRQNFAVSTKSQREMMIRDYYEDYLNIAREFYETIDDEDLAGIACEDLIPKMNALSQKILTETDKLFVTSGIQSVLIELHVGKIPTGSFASDLLRLYEEMIEIKGWKIQDLNQEVDSQGIISKISFVVAGVGAEDFFKEESGTHKVTFNPSHRGGPGSSNKSSTQTFLLQAIPMHDEVQIENLDPRELSVEYFGASTKGGQHANKNENGVRLVHIPTGIEVRINGTRSRVSNHKIAMQILKRKLQDYYNQIQQSKETNSRQIAITSPKNVRTMNLLSSVIRDDRLGITISLSQPDLSAFDVQKYLNEIHLRNMISRLQSGFAVR